MALPAALGLRSRWPRRAAAIGAAGLLAGLAVLGQRVAAPRRVPLHVAGVAVVADQTTEVTTRGVTNADRRWLSLGLLPPVPAGVDPSLTTDALLDLRTLRHDHGVTVAAWSPAWRYVWPRDSAFVTSAYARTGHLPEAEAELSFLQRVQGVDGRFEARYRPDGSGSPDDRGIELDGSGWALWALNQVADELPARSQPALVARYRSLLDRSVAASLAAIDPTGLPPAGMDYWETPEAKPTLATAAVLLGGLRAAARLYARVGDPSAASAAAVGAARLQAAIVTRFEADGYPRHLGGRAGSVDLGATFLLAPFAGVDRPVLTAVWRDSARRMRRPAGGLAPGGSWRRDGISWTPTTATYAMAAACRDPATAASWLRWLDRHRTGAGALPEKVLADGSPASVAPLAWTAAATVITADELARGCR